MGIELGYQLFKDSLLGWVPGNIAWALPGVLVVITLAFITRDTNKWKELALPVAMGTAMAGIPIPAWIYTILTPLFVMEYITIEQLGGLVEVASKRTLQPYETKKTQAIKDRNKREEALRQIELEQIKKKKYNDIRLQEREERNLKNTKTEPIITLKE